MAVNIALLLLAGLLVAHLFQTLRLPGLLGMLLTGVLCGPHLFDLLHPKLLDNSADLRLVALIIILLRAGLGLHKKTLLQIGWTALLLAIVPVTLEGGVVAWLAQQLFALPLQEALLLACVVIAVSPAVVVPCMLDLIQQRRGTNKGIPTLILSAAAAEDVWVIVLFTILLGMQGGTTGSGSLWQLRAIPESILFGVVAGLLLGMALHTLFRRYTPPLTKMTLILLSVAIGLTGVETLLKTHVTMSALLGVMTMGFYLLEKTPAVAQAISQQLTKLWNFAEVLLYVLVGAQVNIHVAWNAGMFGLVLIFGGLAARSLAAWWCVANLPFNRQERLFCVIAYLPKATVQAALGAIPLENGIPSGAIILALAVLAILCTAPLGAVGIQYAGPRWLTKEP